MKKTRMPLGDSGFSLVEIMMAVGFLSVISLGIMRSTEQATKLNKNVQQNTGLAQVKTTLQQLMRDEAACKLTIISNGGVNTVDKATAPGTSIRAIYNAKGGKVFEVDQSSNLTDGLTLRDIKVTGYNPDNNIAQLHLSFQRNRDKDNKQATIGGFDINATALIVLRRKPSPPGSNEFEDCVADQGSFAKLACSSIGGYFNEANQLCYNINIPYEPSPPPLEAGDGHQGYGITSEGGILIENGSLRVGNPAGDVGAPGTITTQSHITLETGGNITLANGSITANGTGGNITASRTIQGRDIYATRSMGVGVTPPNNAGDLQVNSQTGLGTPPDATARLAVDGAIKIKNGAVVGTIDTHKISNIDTVRSSVGLQAPNFVLTGCNNNQVAILQKGQGVSCINSGNLCGNDGDKIRAMTGFTSTGQPNCETILTLDDTSCPAPQIISGLKYSGGKLSPRCCTPSCPASNTYCANEVIPETNGCGVCKSGSKTPGVNTWAMQDEGTESTCPGTCSTVGANKSKRTATQVCVAGTCGGNGSCTPGFTKTSEVECSFTCSLQKRVEVFDFNGAFSVAAGEKIVDLNVYMIGGGGGGGVDQNDGAHGGAAGTVVTHSVSGTDITWCDIKVGDNGGSKDRNCGQCTGNAGSASFVTCFAGVSLRFHRIADGGAGGGYNRNQNNEDGGPGQSAEFFQVVGNSVSSKVYSGGVGGTGNHDCSPGWGPGAGGGGGSDEGGKESGCAGVRGQVIFEYTVIKRDIPGP